MATPNLDLQNYYTSSLSAGITAADTTIPLNVLPTPTEGYLVIEPDSTSNREIIYYTSKTSTAVVCPSVGAGRGVGGTTAVTHLQNATVEMNYVAEMWRGLKDGTAFTAQALTGSSIGSYYVNRKNNSSTTNETAAKIQTGWVPTQPGVNASATIAVTFPVAFTNVPIVQATYGGDTAVVTSTLGSGGANVKVALAEALNITTTGFTLVIVSRDGTNWAANNTVYGHWTAIGT